MVTRLDVKQVLRQSLLKGRIEPMFGLDDVDELNADLERFLRQQEIFVRLGQDWPSVAAYLQHSGGDTEADSPAPQEALRLVPMDLGTEGPEVAFGRGNVTADAIIRELGQAQEFGLPVLRAPVTYARSSFFEGLGDLIFSRMRWKQMTVSQGSVPLVTVTSFPGNQQARWTKGHFFSVHTVFGHTLHSQTVNAGIYCFWLRKDSPSPLMPLYDIRKDTTVPL